jgi:hypothetical protein
LKKEKKERKKGEGSRKEKWLPNRKRRVSTAKAGRKKAKKKRTQKKFPH